MTGPELPLLIDLSAAVETVVPFHDADPAGVAWHGNHFKYFDLARCALLAKIGYGYREMTQTGLVWPVISTEVKYIRPLPYHARIGVVAQLLEWEYRLKIGYVITDASGARAAVAHTVQVAVDAKNGEMQLGAPELLRRRLRAYLDGEEVGVDT
jgi:acyl-CoA thioester hydrolase